MRRSGILCLALLGLAGCAGPAYTPLDRYAQHVNAGAIAWWYAEDSAAVDAAPLVGLLDKRCAVRKMGTTKSAFFIQAAAHAHGAIVSPAFSAMVRSRTVWLQTPDTGERIMDRLRWTGVQINVFMYERDGDHPCHADDLVDGKTNAVTPMPAEGDVRLLFLYEPFFVASMKKNAVRDVARTLVHESLHSMGYAHRGLEPGTEAYNNTPPLYVGCMVEHWGGQAHQDWIKRNCHKANADRETPPG